MKCAFWIMMTINHLHSKEDLICWQNLDESYPIQVNQVNQQWMFSPWLINIIFLLDFLDVQQWMQNPVLHFLSCIAYVTENHERSNANYFGQLMKHVVLTTEPCTSKGVRFAFINIISWRTPKLALCIYALRDDKKHKTRSVENIMRKESKKIRVCSLHFMFWNCSNHPEIHLNNDGK